MMSKYGVVYCTVENAKMACQFLNWPILRGCLQMADMAMIGWVGSGLANLEISGPF